MDPDGNDVEGFLVKLINLYNLQAAVDGIVAGAAKAGSRFILTEETIKTLHRICMTRLIDEAGEYRKVAVKLNGSPFVPPNWIEVPALMGTLCEYVNENWDERDLIHLSAFCMWRFCWIHPFRNGNGRTARALLYMVMCAKYGRLLPPKNTVIQQITQNKLPYNAALRNADDIYAATQNIDLALKDTETFLTGLLKEQIKANL